MKINQTSLTHYINSLLTECDPALIYGNTIEDKFIRLNAYLLSKSQGKDLLITLQARKELPGLLRSVLHYANKHYKLQPLTRDLPQVGNLVYYEKKVFRVVGIEEDDALLMDLIDQRKQRQPLFSLQKIKATTYKYKKNTIDFSGNDVKTIATNAFFYLAYSEWLGELQRKFLREALPALESDGKPGKVLVIVPGGSEVSNIIHELHSIPFQYYRSGASTQSASCATSDSLVDVYSSFDLSNIADIVRNKYREIVVVGDRNCSKYLTDLIRLRNRGRIDRFVLIGTDTPETNYAFTTWHWTKEEVNLLNNKYLNGEVRFKLTGPHVFKGKENGVTILQEHIQSLMDYLEEVYQANNKSRLDKVYFIINEYLRYILPPGKEHQTAKTFLENLHNGTIAYLESEEFKESFYEKGIYNQQQIAQIAARLETGFAALNAFFHEYSPKNNQIRSALKNHEDFEQFQGGRHIITHNSLLEEARQVPDLHNPELRTGVAPLFTRNNQLSFDDIVSSNLNTTSTQFIFPFILNRSQYETMLEANGDVKLYLYEGLEDFKFQRVREAYKRKFLQKINHPDRSLFTASSYLIPEEAAELLTVDPTAAQQNDGLLTDLAQRFYNLKQHEQDFYDRLFQVDDVEYEKEKRDYIPNDPTEYDITFTDREHICLLGYRRVILVEEDNGRENHIQIPTNQVQAGNKIIVYRNQRKELLYDILLKQDTSGVMKEIERASNLWISTLNEISRRVHHEAEVLDELLQEKGIYLSMSTLMGYLLKDRKFPQDAHTLEAIRSIALDYNLSHHYFTSTEQLQNALKRKAQFHSLSITLGRGVSDEVTHYFFTGEKGKILDNLDPEIVEVLKHNIKKGIVESIKESK